MEERKYKMRPKQSDMETLLKIQGIAAIVLKKPKLIPEINAEGDIVRKILPDSWYGWSRSGKNYKVNVWVLASTEYLVVDTTLGKLSVTEFSPQSKEVLTSDVHSYYGSESDVIQLADGSFSKIRDFVFPGYGGYERLSDWGKTQASYNNALKHKFVMKNEHWAPTVNIVNDKICRKAGLILDVHPEREDSLIVYDFGDIVINFAEDGTPTMDFSLKEYAEFLPGKVNHWLVKESGDELQDENDFDWLESWQKDYIVTDAFVDRFNLPKNGCNKKRSFFHNITVSFNDCDALRKHGIFKAMNIFSELNMPGVLRSNYNSAMGVMANIFTYPFLIELYKAGAYRSFIGAARFQPQLAFRNWNGQVVRKVHIPNALDVLSAGNKIDMPKWALDYIADTEDNLYSLAFWALAIKQENMSEKKFLKLIRSQNYKLLRLCEDDGLLLSLIPYLQKGYTVEELMQAGYNVITGDKGNGRDTALYIKGEYTLMPTFKNAVKLISPTQH